MSGASDCTAAQVPVAAERRFVDDVNSLVSISGGPLTPSGFGSPAWYTRLANPLMTAQSGLCGTGRVSSCTCASPCDSGCQTTYAATGSAGCVHYCYDPINGNSWAMSPTAATYAKICGY